METFRQFYSAIIDGGQVDVLEALLRNGADVNVRGHYGNTPLHVATAFGKSNITIVKLLVTHGADVNAKNDSGNTPLHNAAAMCNIEIIKFLIANGADVNVKDEIGVTPFGLARGRLYNTRHDHNEYKRPYRTMRRENTAIVNYLSSITDCQD